MQLQCMATHATCSMKKVLSFARNNQTHTLKLLYLATKLPVYIGLQSAIYTHTDLVALSAKVKLVAVFHSFIDVDLQDLSVLYHLVSVTLLAPIFLWTQAQTDKQQ